MLTWGLLILVVNFIFLCLCIFIGYLVVLKTENKKMGLVVFLIVLLAPFWDLIIQKGVKTYYQAFKMEAKIYAYPELDENGKIESLDLIDGTSRTITWFIEHLNLNRRDRIFENVLISDFKINILNKETSFDNRIKNFLETKVFDSSDRIKKVRIRFDDIKPQFEFIEKTIARYKVVTNSKKHLFDLYTVNEYLLIDNKTDETLAKDMSVGFKKGSKGKFRNKILLWKSANNSLFRIGAIGESGIMKQVLKINYL